MRPLLLRNASATTVTVKLVTFTLIHNTLTATSVLSQAPDKRF